MNNSNIFKISACALFVMVCGVNASAQSSAQTTASATIITPISISKNADMIFGNVAVQTLTAGTVEMTPASGRTAFNGATIPATTGTYHAAGFTVNGAANYTYAISLPVTVNITDGSHTMAVDDFVATATAGTLNGSGTETFYVGATLNVAAAQAAGVYTSASPFDVTVNYN